MLTDKQLEERKGYLGGSDAAAALGLSRWKTTLRLWAEKTEQIPQEDISDKLHIKMGHKLEDAVAELWMEETGKKLHRVNETIYHPSYPFVACNIDRRVVGEDTIFEAKTASTWKAKEWQGDDIPQEYIIQCLHNLAVTGKDKCELAVLIGGNVDFICKTVYRDEKLIGEILKKEVKFWKEFVENKCVPTSISSKDAETLYALYPGGDEKEIELDDTANALIEARNAMYRDLKNIEDNFDKANNEIKALLKDHNVGFTDKFKVTWKEQIKKSYTVKESKARVFRILPLKVKEAANA